MRRVWGVGSVAAALGLWLQGVMGVAFAAPVAVPYFNDFSTSVADFTALVEPSSATPTYDGAWTHDAVNGVYNNQTGLIGGSQRTNSAVVEAPSLVGSLTFNMSSDFFIRSFGFNNNTTLGFAAWATDPDLVTASYYMFDFRPRTGLMRLLRVTGGAGQVLTSLQFGGVAAGAMDISKDFHVSFTGEFLDPANLPFVTSISVVESTATFFDGPYFGFRNRGGGSTATYNVDYSTFALVPESSAVAMTSIAFALIALWRRKAGT
ncbi:MAG TPA: hypothetical protein PJ982_01345 [Lacipirellulaceae bacterium]|mgnify:CR=1 FL=1|nr:hypothetical protein [Lacipirellulaceae bacterium]